MDIKIIKEIIKDAIRDLYKHDANGAGEKLRIASDMAFELGDILEETKKLHEAKN